MPLSIVKEGSKAKLRRSARSIGGMVERFIKKNYNAKKMQAIYDTLTVAQKLELYTTLLPYGAAKKAPESISSEEIEKLHAMVQDALKQKHGTAI